MGVRYKGCQQAAAPVRPAPAVRELAALSLLLWAMASTRVLVFLVLSILHLPPMAGPWLDRTTWEHKQQPEEFQASLEQASLKEASLKEESLKEASLKEEIVGQSDFSWGSLPLFATMQLWQFWEVPGNLVLLVELCSWLLKGIHQQRSRDVEESSSSSEEMESSTEEKEEEEEKENGEEDSDCEGHLFREPMWRSSCRVADTRRAVKKLVGDLLRVLQQSLSDGFFPVPQPAIGVGSAFEGWSPCGHEYCLLVPLKPPQGHAFQLELGTAWEVLAKNRVRVEMVCTCTRSTRVQKNTVCFVHQPYEARQINQDSSLLSNLCTGRYLDAEKTARWFQGLVSSAWDKTPSSRRYALRVLPSSRSCKLELTDASGRCLSVEMVFGVQRGDSDVFLSSQAPEAIFQSSTTWAESYAVAEAKFFRHLARQAPQDTFHLKCLQLYAGTPVGTVLSSFFLKTAVMHVLNFIPLSGWRTVSYHTRLQDIMRYLRSCLKKKSLAHFFFGNELLPKDIVLPPALQEAEPFNIFECLVQGPQAYHKALQELQELEERFEGILHYRSQSSLSPLATLTLQDTILTYIRLCTGRYLDAEKTARWFQGLVSSAWDKTPSSRRYALRVLPSSRSCKLELTDASGRCLSVEMVFGVQRGDSDVFLSSQAPEAIFQSSTTWAESYAVAEAKFFRHLARQAPQDTFHLKCLQLYAGTPVGTVLSSFFLKTAVMHVLNFIPLSGWRTASYHTRLQDIMRYLRSCLKKKSLAHFFFGNELLPKDIVLPPALQEAEPFNIFECLVQGPQAYHKALQELQELEERFEGILHYRV
ncbi:PREDICTED: inositol 1,4,5-trisphosphate receptor-interacting protein-like 1 [Calidris pugnax]|uniref:inositol 1,4,5-trisphosphate receptor-interacting protein-like 1 n=1 Tax=Calidris pugnax TaxID=198806 RepID=UPI00071C4B6E|nr:PREDICTED: inositol 1,4,5-trisphosphate receptor-interacting protein-like 1 [Calidris pugnax]